MARKSAITARCCDTGNVASNRGNSFGLGLGAACQRISSYTAETRTQLVQLSEERRRHIVVRERLPPPKHLLPLDVGFRHIVVRVVSVLPAR